MLEELDILRTRKREDLHCISIHPTVWEQLRILANGNGRSISNYIREVIKKEFKKERRKDLTSVG